MPDVPPPRAATRPRQPTPVVPLAAVKGSLGVGRVVGGAQGVVDSGLALRADVFVVDRFRRGGRFVHGLDNEVVRLFAHWSASLFVPSQSAPAGQPADDKIGANLHAPVDPAPQLLLLIDGTLVVPDDAATDVGHAIRGRAGFDQ
jgi:hypothetical protein